MIRSATSCSSSSTAWTSARRRNASRRRNSSCSKCELAELVATMHDKTNERYMRVMEGGETFESWPTFYRSGLRSDLARGRRKIRTCPSTAASRSARSTRSSIACSPTAISRGWCIGTSGTPTSWRRRTATGSGTSPRCSIPTASSPTPRPRSRTWSLFHTVTPAFMKAYQQQHKLPAGVSPGPQADLPALSDDQSRAGCSAQEYVKPLTAAVEKTAAIGVRSGVAAGEHTAICAGARPLCASLKRGQTALAVLISQNSRTPVGAGSCRLFA